jgi:hypothetical protein
MKRLLIFLGLGLLIWGLLERSPDLDGFLAGQGGASEERLLAAYESRQSGVQVRGSGVVIRTLPDDLQGSRHQRFILRLSSGRTLLISHNIDLAPRIDTLREGDSVEFYGQYEWNPQGGVVHWTHDDPKGAREGGWLRHEGATYQ